MDKLLTAAQFYNSELNGRNFHLKAGKKGNIIEFDIKFTSEHFHHLAGLHKLKDLTQVQGNKTYIFKKVLNGKITVDDIQKSDFFSDIENRLNNFCEIKEALYGKELMIKSLRGEFNSIQADFMLTKTDKNYGYAHLFLINKNEAITVPVTFIVHPNNDYLKNNPEKWTVLSVEEVKRAEKTVPRTASQSTTQKKTNK